MAIIKNQAKAIAVNLPDWLYCSIINLRNIFRLQFLNVKRLDNGLYKARINGEEITFARRARYYLYKRGIMRRARALAKDYQIDQIKFTRGDHVIDCGANIGETGIYLKQFGIHYHSFEPEHLEALCCDINNFGGSKDTNRMALWNKDEDIVLYSNPETADSSVFPSQQELPTITIPATTLATYVGNNKLGRIRLAKIEAEGAEPEVLEGALTILHRIDYISVDVGPERGLDQTSTFNQCDAILRGASFELINIGSPRQIALYKSKGVDD